MHLRNVHLVYSRKGTIFMVWKLSSLAILKLKYKYRKGDLHSSLLVSSLLGLVRASISSTIVFTLKPGISKPHCKMKGLVKANCIHCLMCVFINVIETLQGHTNYLLRVSSFIYYAEPIFSCCCVNIGHFLRFLLGAGYQGTTK